MVFFKVLYERSSIIASFVVHPKHGIRLLSAKVNVPDSWMLPNNLKQNGFYSFDKKRIPRLKIFGNEGDFKRISDPEMLGFNGKYPATKFICKTS